MDIEHITHRGYRPSLVIALVLSAMVVTLASLIGRGTLNLKGSLLLSVPTDVTVIALTEPELGEEIHISEIKLLRKEETGRGQKAAYAYHVRTTDDSDYFARLLFDTASAQWTLERFEKLYGSDSVTPSETENE